MFIHVVSLVSDFSLLLALAPFAPWACAPLPAAPRYSQPARFLPSFPSFSLALLILPPSVFPQQIPKPTTCSETPLHPLPQTLPWANTTDSRCFSCPSPTLIFASFHSLQFQAASPIHTHHTSSPTSSIDRYTLDVLNSKTTSFSCPMICTALAPLLPSLAPGPRPIM